MRLAFKICVTLLLLAAVAGSQEPTTPAAPSPRRQRPQRVVRPQPHLDDPWYPDPPPEGAVNPTASQPFTPPPVAAAPAPGAVATPISQPAPGQQPAQSHVEDLGPAAAPQVAYYNGMLTVRAINSTLESVLNAIRNKAGIQFEGLEGGAPERIAVSMGPLPEGEVLAAILAGSRFDFVVVERADSPGIVQRVLLSVRKGSLPATAQGSGMQPPRPAGGEDEETPDEGSAEPESPQDTPVHPPIMQAQPQMQINPQPPPAQQQPGTSGPKTPEQLLEELKQMQQRQQQQQQQQAPAPQKPPL